MNASEPTPPQLKFLATFSIEVGAPIELGQTQQGQRRIIPITGGTVEGSELSGEILAVGADFQLVSSTTLTELDARYAIRTTAGDVVYVENNGIRVASAEDTAALMRGDIVDPSRVYFYSAPKLTPTSAKWAWLAEKIFVARGIRTPSNVRLEIFSIN